MKIHEKITCSLKEDCRANLEDLQMKNELNLQLLSSLNLLSYTLNFLCFLFFSKSLWLSAKPWVTVQSGRCSLLCNFWAGGSLQQLLMKPTIHSQENNYFQESHSKFPVFSEKGTGRKIVRAAQHHVTSRHLVCESHITGCLSVLHSGLARWCIGNMNTI